MLTMIDFRLAAAKARVKTLGEAIEGLTGEPKQDALRALADAVRDVCVIHIERYGQLTATIDCPETKH